MILLQRASEALNNEMLKIRNLGKKSLKEVRKSFDKMVTYGKKGTLVSRRLALAFLENDKKAVEKVFSVLAPRYKDRNGGYTRIIKMTERKGDNALEVILELV